MGKIHENGDGKHSWEWGRKGTIYFIVSLSVIDHIITPQTSSLWNRNTGTTSNVIINTEQYSTASGLYHSYILYFTANCTYYFIFTEILPFVSIQLNPELLLPDIYFDSYGKINTLSNSCLQKL